MDFSRIFKASLVAVLVSVGVAACNQQPAQQPLNVVDYGPKTSKAGVPFNMQPDGTSAAWFRMNQSMEGSTAWVNFGGSNIRADISADMVTIKVPAALYATPGVVQIVVMKVVRDGRVSAPPVSIKVSE